MVVLRKGSDKAEIRVTKKEPVKGRSGRGEIQVKKNRKCKGSRQVQAGVFMAQP